MDIEDLLVNLALIEVKSSYNWSNEHLLDRLWSSLIKLRSQLGVDQVVGDVFGLILNQVPSAFYFSAAEKDDQLSALVNLFEKCNEKSLKKCNPRRIG